MGSWRISHVKVKDPKILSEQLVLGERRENKLAQQLMKSGIREDKRQILMKRLDEQRKKNDRVFLKLKKSEGKWM